MKVRFVSLVILILTFGSSYVYSKASIQTSYCYQYNNKVAGEKIDKKMRIASLSKLFSSYFLLKTRGADFHYETEFWVDAKNDLYIKGSTDPYFLEHGVFTIIKTLNQAGIKSVRNIYYDRDFIFHFSRKTQKITNKLKRYFKTSRWAKTYVAGNSLSISRQYKQVRELAQKRLGSVWPKKVEFSFKKVLFSSRLGSDSKLNSKLAAWSIKSVDLIEYVKILNSYSNNVTTDEMVGQIGGPKALESFIRKDLDLNVKLFTASGLNKGSGALRKDNLASCRDVLKLTHSLAKLVKKNGFRVSQLMPTAVADVGTLSQRFLDWNYAQNFVYKSGTLKQKPTSALVALHRTQNLAIVSLGQGGKRYISLKNREKDVLDRIVNKIDLKYKRIPYASQDFFMISSVQKTQ